MAHASTRCFSLAEGVTAPFTGFIAVWSWARWGKTYTALSVEDTARTAKAIQRAGSALPSWLRPSKRSANVFLRC